MPRESTSLVSFSLKEKGKREREIKRERKMGCVDDKVRRGGHASESEPMLLEPRSFFNLERSREVMCYQNGTIYSTVYQGVKNMAFHSFTFLLLIMHSRWMLS